ncbi:MAG: GIY-YIG nuclease family protein [Candidatus Rifleibacteriota bacterium]
MKPSGEKQWVVYLLRCSDNSLYTGITNDLTQRLAAHNAGTGARYTRGRRPVEVIFWEKATDKSDACSREYWIKKLSREEKLLLAESFVNNRL